MSIKRIQLIHWNANEAAVRVRQLKRAGYEVGHELPWNPAAERRLRSSPPEAVLIDLSRLPSQGRDWGIALRSYKSMLRVPLVFLEGDTQNIEKIQKFVPDATFTSWSRLNTDLRRAIANPPRGAVKLTSRLAGYADTPLAKKLGIVTGSIVALVDPPAEIEEILGALPDQAQLRRSTHGPRNLTLWFVASHAELTKRIARMAPFGAKGGLWILWPKLGSPKASDLTPATLRKISIDCGLVDFRICRIDETWAGMRFTLRRPLK